MNAMQRAADAYGQATQTLPPIQQIVLLYDGAMRRIKEARAAIEDGRVKDRATAVSKATAIVEGLQSALDHERGGEIAANLDRIYTHVAFRLQTLNVLAEVTTCDELLARLDELRAAWAELAAGRDGAAAVETGPQGAERGGKAGEGQAREPGIGVTI